MCYFFMCNSKKIKWQCQNRKFYFGTAIIDKIFKRQTDVCINEQQVVDQHVQELPEDQNVMLEYCHQQVVDLHVQELQQTVDRNAMLQQLVLHRFLRYLQQTNQNILATKFSFASCQPHPLLRLVTKYNT